MRITVPDRVAAAGDTLFVLEIEFPEPRPSAEKVEVTTVGEIEALDLRGTGAGGSYDVHPGLQALHVPLRVVGTEPGEATVKVDWTDSDGKVTSEERTVNLEPAAEAAGGGAGAKLAVVGLLLAGLAALGFFVVPGLFGGGKVPDVTGKTAAEAEQILTDAGYTVATDLVPVDNRKKHGTVLRTDPKAGDKRKAGAEVRMQVASLLIKVKAVVGLSEQDAQTTLENQGLQPIVRYRDAELPAEVGRVIEQSPAEGDPVPLKQPVTMFVGRTPRGGFETPGPDTPGPDVPGPDVPAPDVPDVPGPDMPAPDVPGPDAPGPDAPGPDTPGPDAPGPDAPGPDAPSPDAPGPDVPGPDTPGPDAPGPDAPGPDAPGPDTPGPDAPGPDAPGPDAPGPDTPGPDAPGPDAPGPDAPGPDAPGPDAPGPDTPGPDAPGPDAPGPDAPGPDAPGPDAPGPDTPGPDTPGPDAPGPDAPGPDAPGPDTPGPDAPAPDAPGPDTPGPDTPGPDAPEPPPVKRGTVPDLVGQSRMVAETLVRRAGLRYRVRLQETSEKPDGTVLSQEPTAGAEVPAESRVTLVVAKRPPERGVDVPDVVGKQVADATKTLRSAGFLVRTEAAKSSGAPVGTVVAQDPPPGAEAPARTWVILTVKR